MQKDLEVRQHSLTRLTYKMKSKIMRVHIDLFNEIEKMSRLNNIKAVEASREAARIITSNKKKRFMREVVF